MGGKNKVICVTLMDDLSVCNEMPSQMRDTLTVNEYLIALMVLNGNASSAENKVGGTLPMEQLRGTLGCSAALRVSLFFVKNFF